MKTAIVIPAFNEAATIARVVSDVAAFGTPVVVDDCSTDNTAELARNAGAVVVQHQKNGGYDAALQSGFEEADRLGVDAVVTFDADGQHKAQTLDRVLYLLESEDVELVFGSRSKSARISEYFFSLYTKWRYGVVDILCGLKGYRISLFREYGRFDGTRSVGTELALSALRSKAKFAAVRVSIAPREEGVARFGSVVYANARIFRAMFLAIFADLKYVLNVSSRTRDSLRSGDKS